jgi:hypothetical protein
MTQPKWKFIDNLGDADPLENGGYFLYHDETGVYGYEAELLQEPQENEPKKWTVRRVCLDRLKLYRHEDTLYLVSEKYDPSWPHPVSMYVEWFAKDLASVAETMGTTREELEQDFCSEDGRVRARAYQCVYDYHGWDNGDAYPRTLTKAEIKKRYTDGEL